MADELTPLRWEDDLPEHRFDEFLDRCCTVLAESARGIAVDLCGIRYMPSTLLGVLSILSAEAKSQEKVVRVIVSESRAHAMRAVGVDKIIEIVAADESGSAAQE